MDVKIIQFMSNAYSFDNSHSLDGGIHVVHLVIIQGMEF